MCAQKGGAKDWSPAPQPVMPMKYTSGHFPLSKSLYGSPVPSNKVLQNLVSADLDNLLSQCTPPPIQPRRPTSLEEGTFRQHKG